MDRCFRHAPPAAMLLSLLAASAEGADPFPNSAVVFHVVERDESPCPFPPPTNFLIDPSVGSSGACPAGSQYTAYLVVCNMPDSLGLAGVEFGIRYDGQDYAGIDVDQWTTCADLAFTEPGWPDTDTGALVTWDPVNNCQDQPTEPFVPNTVSGVAGVLQVTLHSADWLYVTPRPISGKLSVAGCVGGEWDLVAFQNRGGVAGFCRGFGYNACAVPPIAVETTTWGRIKRRLDR